MRDWVADRAAATPGSLALIAADGDAQWTYSDLDAAVEETAGRLAALGVEAGDQVGMVLSTGLQSVRLLHAAQRLGVQLVPLNTRLTPPELADHLEAVDLTVLVCERDTERTGRRAAESTPEPGRMPIASVDEPHSTTVKAFQDVDPVAFEPADWALEDPQLIVFTSGTTGEPKPVVLTTGNLLSSAVASAFRLGIDPADRWLVTLAPSHVGGLAPVFRSTLYGTAVVLRSSFDPGGAADDIDRHDVTVVSLVPTMLSAMLDRRGTLAASLRVVLLGGAPTPASLIERCRNYSVPVSPTYGMTETASQIATARPAAAAADPESVGQPLLWTAVTVVDDAGEPVAPGERGELVVDGPTVTPGYYDAPAETAAAFCSHGFRTGDLGTRREDGSLVVHARLDDRIVTGGENVAPAEVREVLREHPAVVDAAVVGLTDDRWGQRVAALVAADDRLSVADLEAHCRERLAGYKLPRTIDIVEELPRTASGTIERAAVKSRLQSSGVDLAGDDAVAAALDRDAARESASPSTPTPRRPYPPVEGVDAGERGDGTSDADSGDAGDVDDDADHDADGREDDGDHDEE